MVSFSLKQGMHWTGRNALKACLLSGIFEWLVDKNHHPNIIALIISCINYTI